jgi:hypothetical protein
MSCDRFEREGLERWLAGESLEGHFVTCSDCLAARQAYEELLQQVRHAGDGLEPPAGWQARVRQRLAERQRPRHGAWRWGWGLAAAAGLALVLLRPLLWQEGSPPAPPLGVEVVASGEVVRGAGAQVGDRLRLTARLEAEDTGRHRELRVYRNDHQLVFACSGEPRCRILDGALVAEVPLSAPGRYQSLLLVAPRPPEALQGSFDADAGAALALGGRVEIGREVEVY